jgi:HAD superfamily hydrolase (TIGR01509 family)
MPYRAVFFDLDDTLYDDSGSWRTSAAATAEFAAVRVRGLDAVALTDYFLDHSDAYWRAMDPTRETRPILAIRAAHWLATLEAFGHPDRALAEELAHDYGRRRAQGIALFPDALPLLTALRAAGKTLVLITNGLQSTHIERIALLGLEAFFDHTLISDAVGMAKPDPRIFHHALALAGCAPHEAAMVGDNPVNDIAGAQAAGMDAFWFNPHSRPLPSDVPAPRGGEVQTLAALHELLLP